MKLITRISILLVSAVMVGNLFGAAVVFAAETDPCELITKKGSSGIIPEGFNVGNCLKAEGQGDTFAPPKGGSNGGTVSEDQKLKADRPIAYVLIKAIGLLTSFIGGVALIVFIIGAVITIASQGKDDMLTKGKDTMKYALIGLVIALFSFIIVSAVQSVLF
ncbi:hypothetical protein HZA42_00075 [Candidatus Peregrinibacteria bacterium]|nr:hypothetical protein [Candidatus Peregrinibacteria bacterium]